METDVVLRCSGPSQSLILMSFKQETRITDNGGDPTINPACELCQGRRVKMALRDAVLSHLPNPSLRACRANLIIVLTRSHCSDGELSLGEGISLSCNVRCPAE